MCKLVALVACVGLFACEKQREPEDSWYQPASSVPGPDITSTPTEKPIPAILTDAPFAPPKIFRERPAHVVVNLEVTEVVKEIAPGVRYTMWTFGGSVPGKFIRVRQGDVVELHLQNHPSSKLPHNIDLHAVTGPGGGAEPTFTAPGKETAFTFRALNPGLYVYHCATAPVPMHVANGMYGLILVEPPGGLPHVDQEFYVMQGEVYTTGKYREQGLQQFDMDKGIEERPTYVLFNGAEGSLAGGGALKAKVGETVRIFVGNGGPNLTSNFHVIGEIFDRVYTEGGTKVQENVQTTVIPAGGSAIVEFKVEVPGKYLLVDHALFRAFNKGALGTLEVSGETRHDLYTEKQPEKAYTGVKASAVVVPQISVAPTGPLDAAGLVDLGKSTYARVCAACHQAAGQGMSGVFPPLAKSDYLADATGDKLIGHVLHGLQGPITVNGTSYNGAMPPMSFLSDAEIAGVLTYIGGEWGNQRKPVEPEDVAAVRTQSASAR